MRFLLLAVGLAACAKTPESCAFPPLSIIEQGREYTLLQCGSFAADPGRLVCVYGTPKAAFRVYTRTGCGDWEFLTSGGVL